MAVRKPATKKAADVDKPAKKPAKKAAAKAVVVEYDGKNKAAVRKLAGAFYLEHDDGLIQVDAEWVDPGDFVIKSTNGEVHVHNVD